MPSSTMIGKDASSVGSEDSFVDVPPVSMDFIIKIGIQGENGKIIFPLL